MDLDQVLARLKDIRPEARGEFDKELFEASQKRVWVPTLGPQFEGFYSKADELFYGGQAGGGKSELIIGLALTEHRRSLILRRYKNDAVMLADRSKEILQSRRYEFRSAPKTTLTYEDRVIDFDGCLEESDKQRFKGSPRDLIAFDEIGDFLQSQYEFIIAWNRSTTPGQRCRVVCAGNPPTTAEGLWVIQRWAAWLDPTHHRPAADGELRWYTTGVDGREIEVEGAGPHVIDGQEVVARSRTFIRAKLSDNPDLAGTNYDAVLAALPPELRNAYREGRFDLGLRDDEFQVIPTDWIRAAQTRWLPKPPAGTPMCAIGVDVAQGGDDCTVLAPRHDGWYAPLIEVAGRETPDGPSVAGLILKHRRDGATPVIDMGGGYGGSAYDHLKGNGVECVAYRGAEASVKRTVDRQLRFRNKRTEAYWRFREALDPGQPQGSVISLPPDNELVADLTAPKFEVGPHGISITPKEKLVKDLGRSPDKGDAVVMAWTHGLKNVTPLVGLNDEVRRDNRPPRMMDLNNRTPRVDFGPRRAR